MAPCMKFFMSIYSLQVPSTAEFGGHSLAEEIAIALANNHVNVPLEGHQEILLQLLPYLQRFDNYERRQIVKDAYNPDNDLDDVINAIKDRGDRRRNNMALRDFDKSYAGTAIRRGKDTITAISRLSLSAKVRSTLWFGAMMYASDFSVLMLAFQIIAMIAAIISFTSRSVKAPHYLFSIALVGFRYLLDFSNAFETDSGSIVVGTISGLVISSSVLINHFLFSGHGMEYLVGLGCAFSAVMVAVWMI